MSNPDPSSTSWTPGNQQDAPTAGSPDDREPAATSGRAQQQPRQLPPDPWLDAPEPGKLIEPPPSVYGAGPQVADGPAGEQTSNASAETPSADRQSSTPPGQSPTRSEQAPSPVRQTSNQASSNQARDADIPDPWGAKSSPPPAPMPNVTPPGNWPIPRLAPQQAPAPMPEVGPGLPDGAAYDIPRLQCEADVPQRADRPLPPVPPEPGWSSGEPEPRPARAPETSGTVGTSGTAETAETGDRTPDPFGAPDVAPRSDPSPTEQPPATPAADAQAPSSSHSSESAPQPAADGTRTTPQSGPSHPSAGQDQTSAASRSLPPDAVVPGAPEQQSWAPVPPAQYVAPSWQDQPSQSGRYATQGQQQTQGQQHQGFAAPPRPQTGAFAVPQNVGGAPMPDRIEGRNATPSIMPLDLSQAALVHKRKEEPSGGWRRALYKASFGGFNPGISKEQAERNALLDRVRTPIDGCHKIAVVSLKGGIGKTTTTSCLGLTLAHYRGDRVVALDANPDAGTLAERLTGVTDVSVRTMLDNLHNIQSFTDISRYMSLAGRLQVLASDQDAEISEAFDAEQYTEVTDLLSRYYNAVLTDSGTGMLHSAMKGTLEEANSLVVVGAPSVDGSSRASKTLDWLVAHGYGDLVSRSVAVISSVRERSDSVDMNVLRDHFRARCRAVVEIPYDPHLVIGGRIDMTQLKSETELAYIQLAAAVADGFRPDERLTAPD